MPHCMVILMRLVHLARTLICPSRYSYLIQVCLTACSRSCFSVYLVCTDFITRTTGVLPIVPHYRYCSLLTVLVLVLVQLEHAHMHVMVTYVTHNYESSIVSNILQS